MRSLRRPLDEIKNEERKEFGFVAEEVDKTG
jgi:hypothetical protein